MLRGLWEELPALLTPRGCGDQQFNYRDSPGSWHWAGERHCPPPEPPLAASSAPVHSEVLEIWLFSPFFPFFNLYPALLHREKRDLSSCQAFGKSIHMGKGTWKVSLQLWKG